MTTTTSSRISAKRAVPELYQAMLGLDAAVSNSGLEGKLQDLLKFRAAQINGCAYCMDMHSRDALAAGERAERLNVVAGWRAAGARFAARERAARARTQAIKRIADGGVPDDVYDAAAEQFSESDLGALVFLAMTINAWTRLGVATGLTP